jgi:hypothetical protein
VKLPTGNEVNGAFPVLYYDRIGDGFPTVTTGVIYGAPIAGSLRLFASARVDTALGSNSASYRSGNIYTVRLGTAYSPVRFLDLRASLLGNGRGRNWFKGNTMPESGGTIGFVELGATVSPMPGFFLDALLQQPVYYKMNKEQAVIGRAVTVGAGVRF